MTVSKVELKEIGEQLMSGEGLLSGNFDVIRELKVKLDVSLGQSEISVNELMALEEGSILKVDKQANAPLDIFINDKQVAKGIMVVADDNFGIQITEINQ